MEMPQPSSAHQRMHVLAGDWSGEERMMPSPWDPAGGTASAAMTNRVANGGFAVVGDYEQRRGGRVTFTGHAVHMIDPASGEHLLHWSDCMGGALETFRGGWDGDRLVMLSEGPQGFMRMTYELVGDAQLRSSMETGHDGKSWTLLFEARYARPRS